MDWACVPAISQSKKRGELDNMARTHRAPLSMVATIVD